MCSSLLAQNKKSLPYYFFSFVLAIMNRGRVIASELLSFLEDSLRESESAKSCTEGGIDLSYFQDK